MVLTNPSFSICPAAVWPTVLIVEAAGGAAVLLGLTPSDFVPIGLNSPSPAVAGPAAITASAAVAHSRLRIRTSLPMRAPARGPEPPAAGPLPPGQSF